MASKKTLRNRPSRRKPAAKPVARVAEKPEKAVSVSTPAPRLTPPFDITDAERSELLARHRFRDDDIATETDKCGSVLDDIAYEVEGIAEAITHAINDRDHDGSENSRQMADALMSVARSLGDVSGRMMRYAGRLEAYRDAQSRADRAEDMVKAWAEGGLGKPAPEIEVGRAGRYAREAEVTS